MAALESVTTALRQVATAERAKSNAWLFKTGEGQYGHGDKFLGVTVPEQRKIARAHYKDLSMDAVEQLLLSPWHEERLTGLLIMVLQYEKGDERQKTDIANLYLRHTKDVNNWDLVDSSAAYILGPYLQTSQYKMKLLKKLAVSENLWERRIAMLTTFYYIRQGQTKEAFMIIKLLQSDSHDLIQKAVGWMLREIGKNAGEQVLTAFLDTEAGKLPRTTLRYAIERLSPEKRAHYMTL
jgi:3-methyladenine DNA glycosylase AlkD